MDPRAEKVAARGKRRGHPPEGERLRLDRSVGGTTPVLIGNVHVGVVSLAK